MDNQLEAMITDEWPSLSDEQRKRVVRFHALLSDENMRQNLTRLISPLDFVQGHLLDVRELLNSGFLGYPAMDLGSGGGVPGLLAAAISGDAWILAESEKSKAGFLDGAAREMGLTRVEVYAERAEDILKRRKVETVVARAVGKVAKIFGWIGGCSTWNSLVLLKGPGWAGEWDEFQQTVNRGRLRVAGLHGYNVGIEHKKRVIVQLERNVPRGTRV